MCITTPTNIHRFFNNVKVLRYAKFALNIAGSILHPRAPPFYMAPIGAEKDEPSVILETLFPPEKIIPGAITLVISPLVV